MVRLEHEISFLTPIGRFMVPCAGFSRIMGSFPRAAGPMEKPAHKLILQFMVYFYGLTVHIYDK